MTGFASALVVVGLLVVLGTVSYPPAQSDARLMAIGVLTGLLFELIGVLIYRETMHRG